MLELLDRVKKVAASDANVLILGEAGLGIECIALLLHQQSARAEDVFLARNCTAIPEECFESEMFGHWQTTVTGTKELNSGAFPEAAHGTLFLDEIGDLCYSAQINLLHAIQEKYICPVGGETYVPAHPRIICASSRDLMGSADNAFLDELYYCVATVILRILPLRKQREVILPLARQFAGKTDHYLSLEAENRLLAYDWPGNIRELRSTVSQSALRANARSIQPQDLRFAAQSVRVDESSCVLADVERRHILNVIKSCHGNKTDAAKALGLARSTLILKLRSMTIPPATADSL